MLNYCHFSIRLLLLFNGNQFMHMNNIGCFKMVMSMHRIFQICFLYGVSSLFLMLIMIDGGKILHIISEYTNSCCFFWLGKNGGLGIFRKDLFYFYSSTSRLQLSSESIKYQLLYKECSSMYILKRQEYVCHQLSGPDDKS